eukprot:5898200-Pyramimonas_sp.AAC.2
MQFRTACNSAHACVGAAHTHIKCQTHRLRQLSSTNQTIDKARSVDGCAERWPNTEGIFPSA